MSQLYSPAAIANFFLKRARREGENITQMKLHKLVFYAHGWNLGIFERPLLNETVQAWKYGPVVPSLYYEFLEYGSAPIDRLAGVWDPETDLQTDDKDTLWLLDRVWQVYGKFSASQLSALTHEPGSPWDQTWSQAEGIKKEISNGLIQNYFAEKASVNAAQALAHVDARESALQQ